MKDSLPKVTLHRLLARQSGVVKDSLVYVDDTPICSQDNDSLRDRVHNLSQLSFGFPDFFKCFVQCGTRPISLDSDSDDVTRISSELYFRLAGVANFAKVHPEGAQHLSVVPDDWVRPAGQEPCRKRLVPKMQPVEVGQKIGNKDRFSPVRGHATRSETGADFSSVCRSSICLRQVRSCRISHVHTVWLNEENRTKHPVAVCLN